MNVKNQEKLSSIILNAEEVRGLLYGSLSRIVREVKGLETGDLFIGPDWYELVKVDSYGELYPGPPVFCISDENGEWSIISPFGSPGTELYVRETYGFRSGANGLAPRQIEPRRVGSEPIWYQCDGESNDKSYINQTVGKWRSPATMPRWASRFSIVSKSVTVEQIDGVWCWVMDAGVVV